MNTLPTPTPDQLRVWRTQYGLSQARAAELAGVDPRSWKRWEAGDRAVPHWLHTILAVYWGAGPCDQFPAP
jgi:transcriptional regulator with XRE-family HTH domain